VGWTAISPESSRTFWTHNYNPRDMIQTRPISQIYPPLRYTTIQNKKGSLEGFLFRQHQWSSAGAGSNPYKGRACGAVDESTAAPRAAVRQTIRYSGTLPGGKRMRLS
jgi:hypothetical protein